MFAQTSPLYLTSSRLTRNCRTLCRRSANEYRSLSLSSTNRTSGISSSVRGVWSARACTIARGSPAGPTCADRRGTAHLPRQSSQISLSVAGGSLLQQRPHLHLQGPIVSQQSIRGLRNSSKLASNNKFSRGVSVSASSSSQSTATQRSQAIARHFSSSSSTAEMSSLNQYTYSKTPSEYTSRTVGQPFTLDYRCYIEKNGQPVSPFHDIPLYANEQQTILNMIVEIPRWSNAKQEISKEEFLNPIKQDVKKGKLRFVRNCFPHKGYLWNYGAFPRTWEDPNVVHPETKAKGDNDPLDVCEIGELVGYTGQVKQVKVLGVMALLDEEETDWKVIVIDVNDPLAPKLNDVEDVERHLPGLLRATNEWFRIYKIPDGKPENQFAFSGECKNKKYAEEVIRECSDAWRRLVKGQAERGAVSTANTSVEGSPDQVSAGEVASKVQKGQNLPPAPIDGSVDKWFFISGAAV